MPIGLQGQIAPKEALPRLQVPPPQKPVEDLSDIPVVLPAPRRVAAAKPLSPLPAPEKPHTVGSNRPRRRRRWPWLLVVGGVLFLPVMAVVFAEAIARFRGGSLLGSSSSGATLSTTGHQPPSAEQMAREKARSLSYSDATLSKMLELAKPRSNELVIDLGCADGRLALQVADKYGLGVFAWDNDYSCVKLTRRLAEEHFREKLIEAQHTDDVLEVDLSKGDIIFLVKPDRFGGVQAVARRMEPKWFALKKAGVRIVSTQPICQPHPAALILPFHPPDDPTRTVTIYVYETPLN
jgi:hypothetical protein